MSRRKSEIRRGKIPALQIAFGISLGAFIPASAANACGGIFDVACNLPSRPGEFHPEPLTDSGRDTLASSGSCHRTKAAAFR